MEVDKNIEFWLDKLDSVSSAATHVSSSPVNVVFTTTAKKILRMAIHQEKMNAQKAYRDSLLLLFAKVEDHECHLGCCGDCPSHPTEEEERRLENQMYEIRKVVGENDKNFHL